jgi:DNA-directed RNA polymerase specialized sigma24 family protein
MGPSHAAPPPRSGGGDPAGWQAEALLEAIRRLPASDQEVIYLRFYLGLPEVETAAALRIATGTVKSRQHRALARLRAVAQRDYPDLQEGYPNG